MIRRPPRSPLFPYTTLSRSDRDLRQLHRMAHIGQPEGQGDAMREALGHGGDEVGGLEDVADGDEVRHAQAHPPAQDRKSTRLNSSHLVISYAVFCLKKKKKV